jgi:hypothetical protein
MQVRSLSRLATVTAAAATAVVLGTSSASAHFCYVNHMTPKAMAGAANSNGFTTFGEVALEFTGLCPAGIQVLADATGVTVGTPINLHAVMAGGAARQGKEAGGISHLNFAAIDAAFPDAVAACL